jgi:circadian clock protein KaiB
VTQPLGKARLPEREFSSGDPPGERYLLRLYVSGMTPRSARAVNNTRAMCEKHLEGRYELQVIDIYQQPNLARSEQIVAAPTLIKRMPLPLRRLVGDMSSEDRMLAGLDILPSPS